MADLGFLVSALIKTGSASLSFIRLFLRLRILSSVSAVTKPAGSS